ncbi:MAG: cytochrome ubiquinol oxidase subunit I [Capsulimonas sp.]|uniref:cytochrome ubiquinol oxidase subunit I n=1 Tax=Capsulimonas sp. TaxID=2494211 RepID=UPI0032632094
MHLDLLVLSRIQFAMTIMFHYLFPPLSIGLGAVLVFMEGMYLKTKDPQYEAITRFWTRIFAANFAMGVATGIVMEFEFGTNWAAFSRYVGDVFGSALASEGIFAFFLESGFLAVLVFGWDRVSAKFHFFATLMVAMGATFSAIWIVVANSWMQTPRGFHIVGTGLAARAEITDFGAMIFNPSTLNRLTHTLIGAYILGAFFVMSISAYYLLKDRHIDFARKSFKTALVFGTVMSLAAGLTGDLNSRMIAHYQPAKFAAIEGNFHTEKGGTPFSVIGVPDEKREKMHYEVAIPGMLSVLMYGKLDKPVPGLDQIPRGDRPPVIVPYMSYHVMIFIGTYLVGLSLLACFLWWRGTLFKQRWLLWIFVVSVVGPYLANEAGWVTAEVGRQPWIVYGLLRTSEGLSRSVQASQVLGSIIMFIVVYALLFAVWVYVLNDKISHGPDAPHDPPANTTAGDVLAVHVGAEDPAGYSMTASTDSWKEGGDRDGAEEKGRD